MPQPMALVRIVDVLIGGLQRGERFNIRVVDAVSHVANTLPILSEKILVSIGTELTVTYKTHCDND